MSVLRTLSNRSTKETVTLGLADSVGVPRIILQTECPVLWCSIQVKYCGPESFRVPASGHQYPGPGRPAGATGSARQILVGKADGHTGTMGAREHPWCARLGLESTGKALGPQPNAVSTVIGAQWPIPALYKSRPLPCTPGPGGVACLAAAFRSWRDSLRAPGRSVSSLNGESPHQADSA